MAIVSGIHCPGAHIEHIHLACIRAHEDVLIIQRKVGACESLVFLAEGFTVAKAAVNKTAVGLAQSFHRATEGWCGSAVETADKVCGGRVEEFWLGTTMWVEK